MGNKQVIGQATIVVKDSNGTSQSFAVENVEIEQCAVQPFDLTEFESLLTTWATQLTVTLEMIAEALVFGTPLPTYEHLSKDAHSVRFSEMNEEAEREMAEWDAILHGQ